MKGDAAGSRSEVAFITCNLHVPREGKLRLISEPHLCKSLHSANHAASFILEVRFHVHDGTPFTETIMIAVRYLRAEDAAKLDSL